MDNLLQGIWWYVVMAILCGVACVPINILFYALRWCSIRNIAFLAKTLSYLDKMPDNLLLTCRGNDVFVIQYDQRGKENYIPFYSGIVTWKSGNKTASRVKAVIKKQISLRVPCLMCLFVAVGIAVVSMFLNAQKEDDYVLAAGIVFVVALHQYHPFFIWVWPAIGELFQNFE